MDLVPTAHTLPGALSRTALRMYSVDPLSSAACTTSNGTSGCTMTRMPGCCSRRRAICCTVNRVWTEQCPFHSSSFAASRLSGVETAADLVRIPHLHPIERHAHLVGRVAAQVLIGQEQDPLAARPRPLEHGARVARRADDAAVFADEGFDRGRRVDVGDRDDRVDAIAVELLPADLEMVGISHVGHRAAGGEVGEDHLLVRRAQDVGALGHEVHAAEDDEVGGGARGDCARERNESPMRSANLITSSRW